MINSCSYLPICMLCIQTTNEFFFEYASQLNTTATQGNNYAFTFVAPIAYDAVWTLALALNSSKAMFGWPRDAIINETGCQDDGTDLGGFELDDFTYNHTFVGCIIRWNLAQTNFTGVSVSIHYLYQLGQLAIYCIIVCMCLIRVRSVLTEMVAEYSMRS